MKRSPGPGVTIRKTVNSSAIELRDIDGVATTEEILEMVSDGTNPSGARVRLHSATVLLPGLKNSIFENNAFKEFYLYLKQYTQKYIIHFNNFYV